MIKRGVHLEVNEKPGKTERGLKKEERRSNLQGETHKTYDKKLKTRPMGNKGGRIQGEGLAQREDVRNNEEGPLAKRTGT